MRHGKPLFIIRKSRTIFEEVFMENDSDQDQGDALHQLWLERHERLTIALDRAESGAGTVEDWDIIRSECGLPRSERK